MAKLKARTKRAPKPTSTDCAGIDDSQTEELPPG
jgi:hypothetical protein